MSAPARRHVRGYLARESGPEDSQALIELVRSNPIEMEGTYVVDRSPDFFTLHRCFPGSVALVGQRAGAPEPEACASLFRYSGRIGEAVRPFSLLTDLCRRPDAGARALLCVILEIVRAYHATDVQGLLCFVNQRNDFARRMAESSRVRLPLRSMGCFDYVEVMPVTRHRLPKHVRVRAATDRADLERGLALLNVHHELHALWEPLTAAEYERRCLALPGFATENLVLVEDRGEAVGALIHYDPTSLVNLRVLRYDRLARLAGGAVRRLGRLVGLRNAPPPTGEILRTLHVQALGGPRLACRHLLGWLGNLVLDSRAHTYACLADERTPPPIPHRLRFAYKTRLYGTFKPESGVTPEVVARAPLFFNITQD